MLIYLVNYWRGEVGCDGFVRCRAARPAGGYALAEVFAGLGRRADGAGLPREPAGHRGDRRRGSRPQRARARAWSVPPALSRRGGTAQAAAPARRRGRSRAPSLRAGGWRRLPRSGERRPAAGARERARLGARSRRARARRRQLLGWLLRRLLCVLSARTAGLAAQGALCGWLPLAGGARWILSWRV